MGDLGSSLGQGFCNVVVFLEWDTLPVLTGHIHTSAFSLMKIHQLINA